MFTNNYCGVSQPNSTFLQGVTNINPGYYNNVFSVINSSIAASVYYNVTGPVSGYPLINYLMPGNGYNYRHIDLNAYPIAMVCGCQSGIDTTKYVGPDYSLNGGCRALL